MGITAPSDNEIQQYFEEVMSAIHFAISSTLAFLGEQAITRIRKKHPRDWTDRTGNLRSSIGYALLEKGKVKITSAFEVVGEGNVGAAQGKAFINELAEQYADTYALIVVAGMDYAEYVERLHNKDVLSGTQLWAEKKIDKYINEAIRTAMKSV